MTVAIAATGQGNTLVQPAGVTNDKGVATGKFSSTSPGDHTLSATLNGTAATQTAKVTVTAGPPVASNSTAQVGPGTSGAVTTVTVNLKDAVGNSVTGAANKISVTVSGANSASGPVSETGGGAYSFAYTPVTVGHRPRHGAGGWSRGSGQPVQQRREPGAGRCGEECSERTPSFFFGTRVFR